MAIHWMPTHSLATRRMSTHSMSTHSLATRWMPTHSLATRRMSIHWIGGDLNTHLNQATALLKLTIKFQILSTLQEWLSLSPWVLPISMFQENLSNFWSKQRFFCFLIATCCKCSWKCEYQDDGNVKPMRFGSLPLVLPLTKILTMIKKLECWLKYSIQCKIKCLIECW